MQQQLQHPSSAGFSFSQHSFRIETRTPFYTVRAFDSVGIDVGEQALPALETRLEFMKKYAASSAARMARLEILPESRFEDSVNAQICSSGRSPELAIPETGDKVIVYQAGRLHVGVTNS